MNKMGAWLPQRPSRRAFTLLETVLAMVIFALITGAAFSVVRGALKATYEMDALERENAQIHSFLELCRRTFGSLPPDASLEMDIDQDTDPPSQIIQIDDAPDVFGYGGTPIKYTDMNIGLIPEGVVDEDGAPLYAIAMSHKEMIADEADGLLIEGFGRLQSPDDDGRYWMPLVRNVRSMNWRFYRSDEEEWEDEGWDDSEGKPSIAEVTIVQKGRSAPVRAIFKFSEAETEGGNKR